MFPSPAAAKMRMEQGASRVRELETQIAALAQQQQQQQHTLAAPTADQGQGQGSWGPTDATKVHSGAAWYHTFPCMHPGCPAMGIIMQQHVTEAVPAPDLCVRMTSDCVHPVEPKPHGQLRGQQRIDFVRLAGGTPPTLAHAQAVAGRSAASKDSQATSSCGGSATVARKALSSSRQKQADVSGVDDMAATMAQRKRALHDRDHASTPAAKRSRRLMFGDTFCRRHF
ncbi:hypothetical protein FOA52_009574 [Chlamydomonas sp. UWO 241]|nr:hypothetical protein FOA52_009574 [Chlamydomonas sp. UWO 241]